MIIAIRNDRFNGRLYVANNIMLSERTNYGRTREEAFYCICYAYKYCIGICIKYIRQPCFYLLLRYVVLFKLDDSPVCIEG